MSARSEPGAVPAERVWHLAQSAHEVALTDFEYQLLRVSEAFYRWESQGMTAATGVELGPSDLSILHIVRMHDRPKGLTEIARLLNRDDIPNIQYSLRKLEKLGMIGKRRDRSRKTFLYETTARGSEITDRYAQLRRSLLVRLTQSLQDADQRFGVATLLLELLTGIYDQATRAAATHPVKPDAG